jgi:hypothetical protein
MGKIGKLFVITFMLLALIMPGSVSADEMTLDVKNGQIGFDTNIALQNSDIAKIDNGSGHSWSEDNGGLHSPNNGRNWTDTNNLNGNAPQLTYSINFDNPGTYNVWVQVLAPDTSSDSIHIGADSEWKYWKGLKGQDHYTWNQLEPIVIDETGLHDLNLWVREDACPSSKFT